MTKLIAGITFVLGTAWAHSPGLGILAALSILLTEAFQRDWEIVK